MGTLEEVRMVDVDGSTVEPLDGSVLFTDSLNTEVIVDRSSVETATTGVEELVNSVFVEVTSLLNVVSMLVCPGTV